MTRDTLRVTHRVLGAATLLVGLSASPTLAGAGGAAHTKSEATQAEAPEPSSVLLGRFMLRDLRTVEGAKTRLSFSLYGLAAGERFALLERLTPQFEHRVRSEVSTAVRLTPLPDFQQPSLDRFRRRVLARLRRALPALPIEALLIGEFELFLE